MSTLRTLKRLVLGETWTLPVGIAASTGLASALTGDVGAFVLLAGLLITLVAGVSRSARGR